MIPVLKQRHPGADQESMPRVFSIEPTPDGLTVVMPAPRAGCAVAFLGTWLAGWLVGELSALRALAAEAAHLTPASAFVGFWLLGWTLAGAATAAVLAFVLDGAEVLTLAPDALVRRAEAFGRGLTWRYELGRVRDLRTEASGTGEKTFIGFEYDDRHVRLGTGLTEYDARAIVEAFAERVPGIAA
jgi:hypothetical protein